MNYLIYAIFIVTYLLIASRRLYLLPIGRPAGALFGATLMVACGALTPEESYQAIDHNTIVILFAMMLISIYLQRSGFFDLVMDKMIQFCHTPWKLLAALSLASGGLSAFLMNDAVCIFFTPMVVTICKAYRLPFAPYLICLATSTNIGSSATLVGNPQNMIIGSLSGMDFTRFMMFASLPAITGMILNVGLLWLFFRRKLPASFPNTKPDLKLSNDDYSIIYVLLVTSGVIIGFFAGFHLGYTALVGVLCLIIVERQEPVKVFAKVDWTLLVFFSCLFIVIRGLTKTNIVEIIWQSMLPYLSFVELPGLAAFTALMTIGSNIVSNVPMVMLAGPLVGGLGHEEMGWVLLAFITTVAGNLTLIGAVANIIVAEGARNDYQLGFFEYLKFGFVSTVMILAAGVSVIWLCFAWQF